MTELTEIKEICEKIDVEKEILGTMPKNNEKNKEKYKEKLSELKQEYKEIQDKIEKILNTRYKKATEIESVDEEIQNISSKINKIENELNLLSTEKTSYEKMKLDRIIYKIGRYYRENLENINEQIGQAIKKFEEVGITLELSDFDYSAYVKQYMEVFFEEKEKGDINSSNTKAKFEEIYWKCPELIVHIELNIRNLYLKKEVQINKFLEKEKNELLKEWKKTPDEIRNSYMEMKLQKEEIIAKDKKILLDRFLSGELNIKDYSIEKIQMNYSKILTPEKLETNQEQVEKHIFEFLNSLYEYKNYLYFKFLIDDLKNHYANKENYKKVYDETKKQIENAENKLKKLNKKALKKGWFRRKTIEVKQSAEKNQIIMDIKKLYKELDLNKFYNKIYSDLNDDSTIYEALSLANSYYNYLTECLIINKNTAQEKIDEQIKRLDDFLKNPHNNIINNLTIVEEKDVALIIKDRYKLLNFNIEKEDFSVKSIDNMIATLEYIVVSIGLRKANLKVEEIKQILSVKEVLLGKK